MHPWLSRPRATTNKRNTRFFIPSSYSRHGPRSRRSSPICAPGCFNSNPSCSQPSRSKNSSFRFRRNLRFLDRPAQIEFIAQMAFARGGPTYDDGKGKFERQLSMVGLAGDVPEDLARGMVWANAVRNAELRKAGGHHQPGLIVLTPSTPFAYPQVVSRTLASFRAVRFRVSAGQCDFSSGFDSRQLHLGGRSKAALSSCVSVLAGNPLCRAKFDRNDASTSLARGRGSGRITRGAVHTAVLMHRARRDAGCGIRRRDRCGWRRAARG